uniref:CCHC-type domain-containing protein n=1 Tax=Poecilia formosa TaxID=48698 RepID=A0A096MFZ9_POEFO
MWVKKLPPSMTEQSGQDTDPAETLRRTIREQHTIIQTHDSALKELSNRQAETNSRLDELITFLQASSRQATAPAAAAASAPDPAATPPPAPPTPSSSVSTIQPMFSGIQPLSPERFAGETGSCRGFLLQCSILFNHSPQSFPHDNAKISFIISRLSGQALCWAESRFPSCLDYGCTFEEFLREFKMVFSRDADKATDSRELWSLKQGQRTVSEFAIDFRIKAVASGWNQAALKSAYFHALNEQIKDELATLDEPATLDEFINLTIRLDNRIRARKREKSRADPAVRLFTATRTSPPAVPPPAVPDPEPMQLGHTRLTPEERQRRLRSKLCLYCGDSGHFISNCELRLKAQVRQRF